MSLNIDMKMIRSVNSSSLMFRCCKLFWIFWRICNDANPGKIFESDSIGLLFPPIFKLHLCFHSFHQRVRNRSGHVLLPLSTEPLDHETILISSMREIHSESYSHSLSLQNAPISISVRYLLNSELPRRSCYCRLPSSPNKSVQDGWRLSLTKTWTFLIPTHLS